MLKSDYKILVVEDDENLNFLLRKKISDDKFITEGARTGKEAINWAKKNKYGLLLLDFNLPDINAKEVIRIISKMNLDIDFIIITGHGDERIAVEMMKLGVKDYIIKDSDFIEYVPAILHRIFNEIKREKKLKDAEKALIESEERYRKLVELSPDAIIVLVKDKIVYINSAGIELFHVENYVQILGKSLIEFIHKGYKEKFQKKIKEAEKNIDKYDLFQHKIICSDGKIIDTEAALAPILYKGIRAFQIVIRDISDRIKIKEELITEKERLSVTLRSISDGMIALDVNSRIVLINKIAERLTGFNQKEAIGRKLEEIFHIIDEKTRKPHRRPLEKMLEEGLIIKPSTNNILISKDGMERNLITSAAPIKDKNNNVVGTVLVFRDITRERRMEEELQKIQRLESLGVLAGGIAHDFNNVITGISGNISLAMFTIDINSDAYKILSDAQKAVIQAKALSQQLLTFSKGGLPIKKVVDLRYLLNDSVPFLLRGSKSIYDFNLTSNLWAVEVDENQIKQVIANIIINADQAMPEGGTIKIESENVILKKDQGIPLPDGKYIKISIKDEGIGIPNKYLSKIFDPYFTTKQKGTGLGLSTCFSIIKKHYGYITVNSKLGKGTSFDIFLPASQEKIKKSNKKEKKITIKGKRKILVMDDDEIVRNVIEKMLKYLNYNVDFAVNGKEAIKLYKESMKLNSKYDIVIMDLTIPGSSGGDKVIKELIKLDKNIKAIVSSGYSNKAIMSKFKDYGFCGAINKPYRIEELNEVIQSVINLK